VTRIQTRLLVALIVTAAVLGSMVERVSTHPKHPTLFVGPSGISAPENDVQRQGRDEVVRAAEWALKLEIPSEPEAAAKRNPDKSYNPKGLAATKAFLHAGVALQHVMPALGAASQLTREPRYAARAVKWLDEFSRWSRYDVSKPDIAGAASLVGMVVGYDFFYNDLSSAQRTRLLGAIERQTQVFTKKTVSLGRLPLAENRSAIASNHNVVPACAAGLGALLLKLEGRDDGAALNKVVATFRGAILPASFSPEGEYSEGPGQFFEYVINSMTVFFEALRRNGGPNMWQEGHLRKVPEFIIRAEELSAEDAPYNYRLRHTLLAMAAVYRDPELQGVALREGLRVGPGAKEISFPQPKPPVDAKGARPWFSSAWEYLFLDPSLKPGPLKPRPLATLFPNLGRAILRSGWTSLASIVTFRSGPRTGKDVGDHNAFEVRAFGADLLPRLEASLPPLAERDDEAYAEFAKIRGTHGNNTILVDGQGQFSGHDPKAKARATPAERHSDWLAGAAGAATAPGHITGFLHATVVDYVSGEAANAYHDADGRRLLERFRRHVFFAKDEYVVVVDDIKSAGGPRDIEWRFHAGRDNTVTPAESAFTFRPEKGGEATALLRVLRPRLAASVKTLDVSRQEYRSPFVSVRMPAKQTGVVAMFAIDLQRKGAAAREFTVVRDDDQIVVVRAGNDIIAWNRTGGTVEFESLKFSGQGAWLRPEAAAILVEGTTLEWKNARLIQSARSAAALWTAR
jgi:hypothetical protein